MATVPTYDQPTTRLNAAPNVQQQSIASEALFVGASNAEEMAGIGKGLANVAAFVDKRQEDVDTATALNAEVTSREAFMKFQSEARARRGLAADGIVKDTEKWWEDQARTTTAKMNPRQQELYIQRMRGTRLSTLGSMADYQDGQVRSAKQEGAQAAMASAIKLSQDDPMNPNLLNEALNTIQVTTSRLGTENGDAPEKVQMDMLTRTSTLHSGIVGQIVDTNPKAARAYLNKYGEQMTYAARGQITKALEVAERSQEVLGNVGEVMTRAKTETEALAMVRDKFANDAEAMKMAVNEVKTRYNEQADAQEKYQKVVFDRAWQIAIDNGKGRKGIDAATWAALTPQQSNAIDDELYQRGERGRIAQDRAEAKRDKVNVDAQWDTYYAIRQQARDNPNGFKERDLRMDFKHIPKEKREELIDLQAKKPDELKDVTTLDGQISMTVGKLGLEKKPKYQFESVIRDAVTQAQKAKGKPLVESERQAIIDNMVIDGEVPGTWDDKEGRAYEFVGTPDASKFVPNKTADGKELQSNKIYVDKHGNKARYVNGVLVEVK